MDNAVQEGFVDAASRKIVMVASTVPELLRMMDEYVDPLPTVVAKHLHAENWKIAPIAADGNVEI